VRGRPGGWVWRHCLPPVGLMITLLFLLLCPSVPFAWAEATSNTAELASLRICPITPDWFHASLVKAVRVSGDLPSSWADSPYLEKIVCWQGSGFDVTFTAIGDTFDRVHGLYSMTTAEVQTMAGPWMIRNRYALKLSIRCFVWGWDRCPHKRANTRVVQQNVAAMRWIWLNYGHPKAAWNHIIRTGRFNSYPREGTDDIATRRPFRLCPVAGSVRYSDDFGQPRHVGGYHPHWGNDITAPKGRPIRAPFNGLAVAHRDSWFAGRYVTVVGAKGYVRNGHLNRFGNLGYVKAGTIIGYVGDSGDAAPGAFHDHFEWHPWVVPTPLHRAPSGFKRVMDAIDPFPFLKKVCT
jgi:peptidase M23-like protein